MHLIDVHAHLDHEKFTKDLPEVIKRAKAKGISVIIAQGINHESNMRTLALAKIDPCIKIALGLYPSEARNVTLNEGFSRETSASVERTLQAIEHYKDRIVAIGEVGMDLKESSDITNQRENLRKIIKLAKKLRKPVILHSRKAEKEVLDLLEEEKFSRAVMHCFTGSKKLLQRGLKLGLMFSIPTSVVRNEQFQQNAELLPLSNILTETDAPFMRPMKDLRNEPANIREALLKIAEIKRLEPEEAANAIFFNYQKLFQ